MKLLGLLAVLAVAVFMVSVAVAQTTDDKPAIQFKELRAQVRQETRVAPLRLPNITGLTKKLLRAERPVWKRQLVASGHVIRFWENKGKWLRATRHEKCWEVPWQRSCTIARASYRLHLTLSEAAQRRLWRVLPPSNDWPTSLRIVQRVFPGTYDWGMNCSAAEGSHGRFVLYQGKPYFPGAEYTYTFHGPMVGGWMQYMWGTFKGHYRNGLDALRRKGFEVRLPAVSDVRAWRSPLAQAIAATWARWSGNDNSHWSASSGNGC